MTSLLQLIPALLSGHSCLLVVLYLILVWVGVEHCKLFWIIEPISSQVFVCYLVIWLKPTATYERTVIPPREELHMHGPGVAWKSTPSKWTLSLSTHGGHQAGSEYFRK